MWGLRFERDWKSEGPGVRTEVSLKHPQKAQVPLAGTSLGLETMIHTLPLSSQDFFSSSLVPLHASFFLMLEI